MSSAAVSRPGPRRDDAGPGTGVGGRAGARGRGAADPRGTAGGGTTGGPRGGGLWPWFFIAPTLIGIGALYVWPLIQNVVYSFAKWGPFGGAEFNGTANYERLFTDSSLLGALANTLIYTGIVLLGIPIAIVVATLLDRPGLKGAWLYRILFLMPYIAMPTAVALVWRLIFNGDFGVLNQVLARFGIDGPHWVSTPGYALVAVSLVGLWSSLGLSVIILGAGLRSIPAELYEAAQLDGAGGWRILRSITVPLLTPSIFFVSVITFINAFQLFDLLLALLGQENPAMLSTQSLVLKFYNVGFVAGDRGYAAAISVLILLIIGAMTALQFRLQRRWVHYG